MASCSKFLLAKVLFLQANGQQTSVSVESWKLFIMAASSNNEGARDYNCFAACTADTH